MSVRSRPRREIREASAEQGSEQGKMRAMAPAVASAAVAVRLLGALASLALLTSFVAATRAEDAAPATPDLPIPKAEALLGIDLDYDHVTKYFDNDKVTRTGVWDLKYGLDEGGGSLTRWASSGSTNTKDAGLDVDHEVKTRCDRRRDLEIWVTLGEDDARFSATALAQKGGKSFVSDLCRRSRRLRCQVAAPRTDLEPGFWRHNLQIYGRHPSEARPGSPLSQAGRGRRDWVRMHRVQPEGLSCRLRLCLRRQGGALDARRRARAGCVMKAGRASYDSAAGGAELRRRPTSASFIRKQNAVARRHCLASASAPPGASFEAASRRLRMRSVGGARNSFRARAGYQRCVHALAAFAGI